MAEQGKRNRSGCVVPAALGVVVAAGAIAVLNDNPFDRPERYPYESANLNVESIVGTIDEKNPVIVVTADKGVSTGTVEYLKASDREPLTVDLALATSASNDGKQVSSIVLKQRFLAPHNFDSFRRTDVLRAKLRLWFNDVNPGASDDQKAVQFVTDLNMKAKGSTIQTVELTNGSFQLSKNFEKNSITDGLPGSTEELRSKLDDLGSDIKDAASRGKDEIDRQLGR